MRPDTYFSKQEHPRESIVETQGLHQDGFSSLSYNGMKFSNCGSNIAQNHSSSLQEVISGHYLPQFTYKIDQRKSVALIEGTTQKHPKKVRDLPFHNHGGGGVRVFTLDYNFFCQN